MSREIKRYQLVSLVIVTLLGLATAKSISNTAVEPQGPTIASFSLSPASVTGGTALKGQIILDRAAGSAGHPVPLSSSHPEVTLPASVVVPFGKTSITFAINTTPVVSDTLVKIAAGTNGAIDQKSVGLTVLAPVPKSLVLSSVTTVGGQTVRATVTLTGLTATGLKLPLGTTNTSIASVPSSVGIPAGKGTASFDITTNRVTQDTGVRILISTEERIFANLTVTLPLIPELISMSTDTFGIPTCFQFVNLVFDRPLTSQQVVQFTSSNPTVLPVTASMGFSPIEPATNTVKFAVTPSQVTVNTPVTITATVGNSTKTVTTTIQPLVLQTFSASATDIVGGGRPIITMALNLPRINDTQVTLTSSSNLVSIPSSITIPSRTSISNPATVTFEAITQTAISPTTVTLTATLPSILGGSKTLTLNLQPVTLTSLSLQTTHCDLIKNCPSSISGSLSLNGGAPPEGVTVSLTSDRTQSATVSPTTVLIPSGQSTGAFTVSIPGGAPLGNVRITAVAGSGSAKFITLELVKTFLGVDSLALSTNTTQGGSPITGTVTVKQYVVSGNGPVTRTFAPATESTTNITVSITGGTGQGQQVSLSVPAAQSTGSFTFTPAPVSATETKNVGASAQSPLGDGSVKSTSLTINPATLNSISLAQNEVQGGTEVQGTVQLSAPVPFSNSVTVSSSDTNAASIMSTTFFTGSNTGAVTIKTSSSVLSPTPVTISASFAGQTTTAQLTVTKPSNLSAIAFPAPRILAGFPTTLRIDLDGPAPGGGALVGLNTANPGRLTFPQSQVTVPAGQTSFSVQLNTGFVSDPTTVFALAGFKDVSKQAQVILDPVFIDVCNASPSTVLGGSTINCTVMLVTSGHVAPEGGIQLSIQNSNPSLLSVPSTVTIPAGQTSTTLQITTQQVTQNTSVNLQLTRPNQGFGRSFTLTP